MLGPQVFRDPLAALAGEVTTRVARKVTQPTGTALAAARHNHHKKVAQFRYEKIPIYRKYSSP